MGDREADRHVEISARKGSGYLRGSDVFYKDLYLWFVNSLRTLFFALFVGGGAWLLILIVLAMFHVSVATHIYDYGKAAYLLPGGAPEANSLSTAIVGATHVYRIFGVNYAMTDAKAYEYYQTNIYHGLSFRVAVGLPLLLAMLVTFLIQTKHLKNKGESMLKDEHVRGSQILTADELTAQIYQSLGLPHPPARGRLLLLRVSAEFVFYLVLFFLVPYILLALLFHHGGFLTVAVSLAVGIFGAMMFQPAFIPAIFGRGRK